MKFFKLRRAAKKLFAAVGAAAMSAAMIQPAFAATTYTLTVTQSSAYTYMSSSDQGNDPSKWTGIHLATITGGSTTYIGYPAYCIEFSKTMGSSFSAHDTLDNWLTSNGYSATEKAGIRAATIYGYQGTSDSKNSLDWEAIGSSNTAAQVATQYIIWEYTQHYRTSADADNVTAGLNGKNTEFQSAVSWDIRQRYYITGVKPHDKVLAAYKAILRGIQYDGKNPKFGGSSFEMPWNESKNRYQIKITDERKIINTAVSGQTWNITTDNSKVHVEQSNSTLTIWSEEPLTKECTITLTQELPSSVKAAIVLDASSSSTQDMVTGVYNTEPTVRTLTVTTGEEPTGNLTIRKTSEDDKISGIKFTVTGPNNYNQTFTTDEDGQIIVTGLPVGTYTVSENGNSATYVIPADKTVEITAGDTGYAEFYNELQKGGLVIQKTSEDDAISGVEFVVTGPNGYQKTFQTDENGKISISGLPVGTYTAKEKGDSTKYVIPADQTVNVTAGKTASLSFHNELQKGSLVITKTSEDGVLRGFSFTVTGPYAYSKEFETDENGKISISDLPVGEYTVRENSSGNKYALPADQTITITAGGAGELSFYNELTRVSVKINKLDDEHQPLSGAKLVLYDSEDKEIDAWTSDGTTHTVENLVVGSTYRLHEEEPPEDYAAAEDITFTVLVPDGSGDVVTINNQKADSVNMIDQPVLILPETGSAGMLPGFIAGGVLILLGGIGLAVRKHKKDRAS